MRRRLVALRREPKANGLGGPENDHADSAGQEQRTTTNALDEETSCNCDRKIPDLQNTVNEELSRRVRDANRVEDLVKVVGNKTVARPLREESNGNNDSDTPAVTWSREERLPANVSSDSAIEVKSCLNLLKFVLHKGVLPENFRNRQLLMRR